MPSAPGIGSRCGTSASIRLKTGLARAVGVGEAADGDPGRTGIPPPGVPAGVPIGDPTGVPGVAAATGRVGVSGTAVGLAGTTVAVTVAWATAGVSVAGGSGVGVDTVPPHAASSTPPLPTSTPPRTAAATNPYRLPAPAPPLPRLVPPSPRRARPNNPTGAPYPLRTRHHYENRYLFPRVPSRRRVPACGW
jgi:hypothetical protein